MNAVLPDRDLFRIHFLVWKILGLISPQQHRNIYVAYSIFMNILITIGYPLHLMLGLLMSTSLYDILKNFTVNMTCVALSVKTIACWLHFQNIDEIMDIIRNQNKQNCMAEDELQYNRTIYRDVRLLLSVFLKFYTTSWALCELSVLCNGFMGTWDLMFPAYFPFDPFASTLLYIVAHIYQFVGVSFQILQGVVMDTFSVMNFSILSGQLHTLNMKVAKLGSDSSKTKEDNNRELLKCVDGHKELLRYRCKLEEVISVYMFFQILVISVNLSVTVVFLIFFADDLFTILFYFVYFVATFVQILPMCYYGTLVETEFDNLTYTLFECNWLDQDDKFKKNLKILIENTMNPVNVKAWLFPINLNLFVSSCKNAYSLFALVMNFK